MSLPRLLAWLLGALVVIAALALLLARGFGSTPYDAAEREAILAEWARIEALARVPPPPPPGTPLADDFARRLADADGDAEHAAALQDFAEWLAGPGPHRPAPLDQRAPGGLQILDLLEAGTSLAERGEPDVLPGLLDLGHALRTEGHLIDMSVGIRITDAVLDRLQADGLPLPPGAGALAPTEDEPLATLARDAVATVQLLDTGGLAPAAPRPVTQSPIAVLAGAMARDRPAQVLALALRRAAIDSLDPAAAPGAPPSTWDLFSEFVFGDTAPLEHRLTSVIRPSSSAFRLQHTNVRQRFADALAAQSSGDPAHAASAPDPDAAGADPDPGASSLQPADGPPGG